MRKRESRASLSFLLMMVSMRSRNLPLVLSLENYKFMKKQARSLRSYRGFFLLSLRTRRQMYFMPRTRPSFIKQQRLFSRAIIGPRLSLVLLVYLYENYQTMEKDKEGEDEWIAFSVHARESYHWVNEERGTKFVMGFEKGKKSRTRGTLEPRRKERLSFSLSDRPFSAMSQSIIRTNYLIVIKAALDCH